MNSAQTNLTDNIAKARELLKNPQNCSPELAAIILLLLSLFELLLPKLFKNSKNSSMPPSQDPNRAKTPSALGKKKPVGQPGRVGTNLTPFETPDEIIPVPVELTSLPGGRTYRKVGIAKRQVVEIIIKRHVKEYQLEIIEDDKGKRYTATALEGAGRPVQYGSSVKAMAVYMSMYQLIPYGRVEDYFRDQAQIPLCQGSLFNFNQEAFLALEAFEKIAKIKLQTASLLHADETSINVNGKRVWLHNASNDRWTLFAPHVKRGAEAMQEIGILPAFRGVMVHDHWKPYFTFKGAKHALCHAHHLRELQAVVEAHPEQTWAQKMKVLLCAINEATGAAGAALGGRAAVLYRRQYREILKIGDQECPPPPDPPAGTPKKKGRVKKTKARNLLERLRDFEAESLRFMTMSEVPFTNNQGENDIRMTKVQQKISGCFKSWEGSQIFCRIRSYLLTSQKHGIGATDALTTLFQKKLPDFCTGA